MKLQRLTMATIIGITSVFAFSGSASSINPNPLFAVLLGGNEVNAAGQANAGDTDGIGSISVIIIPGSNPNATGTLCFGLTVNRIAPPTVAHIHNQNAGLNGPIVVNLAPVPLAGNPGTSSGCVGAPNAVLQAIQSDPSRYYVNIHNQPYPNGALRGQLF